MHDCGEGRGAMGAPGAPLTRRLVMVGQNPPCDLYIQGSGVGVCGEFSNQVQGLFKIHLIRCPPLQTFARAVLLLWRPVLFQKPVLDQGKNLRVIELALAVVTCRAWLALQVLPSLLRLSAREMVNLLRPGAATMAVMLLPLARWTIMYIPVRLAQDGSRRSFVLSCNVLKFLQYRL